MREAEAAEYDEHKARMAGSAVETKVGKGGAAVEGKEEGSGMHKKKIIVVIPVGAVAGKKMIVKLPNGHNMPLVCPVGGKPGMKIACMVHVKKKGAAKGGADVAKADVAKVAKGSTSSGNQIVPDSVVAEAVV